MKNPMTNKLAGGLSKLSQAASARKDSVSGTVVLVKPSDCYEEDNPRTDFDQNLIDSYAEDFLNPEIGQEEAIQLYPADKDGKHRVQHGATRLRAGLLAEKKNPAFRLKAIIDDGLSKKDELENFLNRGMNNIKRDNMTLRDRANFIGNYMDKAKENGKSVTQGEIAKRLGLKGGASYVSRLLKLRDMTPEMDKVYQSGSIDDIEALATLAELQKDNPELFNSLIALPDLDRATIRRAKKTGKVGEAETVNQQEMTSSDTASGDKAGAPRTAPETQSGADESVETIPFVDYLFQTGQVNILIKKVENGFVGALETLFEHGINEAGTFEASPVWATENEAISYAKTLVAPWIEKVSAAKDELNVEEVQDLTGYLNTLNPAENDLDGNSPKPAPAPNNALARSKKNPVKQLTLFGLVNGEECILLTQVTNEVLTEQGDTAGFVYVQVGGEIKIAKVEDFVITGASYRA
ncbi:KorB domain-containing protein (plasmid) [Enterobacter hormaechei]|uniref:ParB/RepB/Spo0J family partition protein n=1 Tax=Enterobacter hormaechei TaxID=158836 RepID=UPI0027D2FE88|nr:KorB domain-containing protein [Enterobacter hormaechei]WLZ51913.1 KorB domain-containing protein [Enterobacter hormaechei]